MIRNSRAALAAMLLAVAPLPVPAEPLARVIVKFKADATLLAKRASVTPEAAVRERAAELARKHGEAIVAGAPLAERMQVVRARGIDAEALARKLAADPDVEFAEVDRRVRIQGAPNDPLYPQGVPGNGPTSGQWYLRAPGGEVVSAIDAERAWSMTRGSPAIVVAVVDTGVRFDHPDLQPASAGGNLLPGYDMIADVDTANDGDGRDADASDPGDWISDADLANPSGVFADCAVADSSWHGTKVAGLIAALTDNGLGMASVGRTVRVLPVRAIGKCGGFESDIVAALRWAAGLQVPGVPGNPTPARVINLSLGSASPCSHAYRSAVSEATAMGAVIVASAGNAAGHAVSRPANCDGAIAVAALRHAGTKVGFSNLGAEVALAAPGGNCVNTATGTPCLFPILTTSDAGRTAPMAASYSDAFRISVGTSFSAPLVAGTAALMLAVRPELAPAQVRSFLRGTTRPFATRGGSADAPRCTAPSFGPSGQPVDQLECYCTTSTCGAGMLDAGTAVAAAQAGVQSVVVVEYYNAALDHYFITWLPGEIAELDAGTRLRGWVRTGATFNAFLTPQTGTSPVCRYYIPPALGDSHFYGRGHAECEGTGQSQPGLQLEDARFMHMVLPAGGVCPAATVPVYRVFSARGDANHRYMTRRDLREAMIQRGWLAEGDGPDFVVMCAPA